MKIGKVGIIIIAFILLIVILTSITIHNISSNKKENNSIHIKHKEPVDCSKAKVTITYDCDGGTGGGSETFICGKENQKITKSCSKKGKKQDGWKITNLETTKDLEKNNVITDDWIMNNAYEITLYVHWKGLEIKCIPGEYLQKGKKICKKCLPGYYCKGGKYTVDKTKNQGINKCPTGYDNSKKGSKKESDCFIKVEKNNYIKEAKTTKQEPCPSGQTSLEHNVYYDNNNDYCKCMKAPSLKYLSTNTGKKYIVGTEIKNKDGEKFISISGCTNGLNGFSCYKNPNGSNCINQSIYRNNESYKNTFGQISFTKDKWTYSKTTDNIWTMVCNNSKCSNYYS